MRKPKKVRLLSLAPCTSLAPSLSLVPFHHFLLPVASPSTACVPRLFLYQIGLFGTFSSDLVDKFMEEKFFKDGDDLGEKDVDDEDIQYDEDAKEEGQ